MIGRMQTFGKGLVILVSIGWFLGCHSSPVKDISKDDLFEDETEVEVERGTGINEDINPFDRIQRVNEEKDVMGMYEGDIKRNPSEDINEKRNAINDKKKLWVGKVVPYIFDSTLSDTAKSVINLAMEEIQNNSCVVFKHRQQETHYIRFFKDQGCWSYVGRYYGGVNDVSIGNGCEHKGIVIHELLHALGFWHEQSRTDRGNFIEIFWENIQSGFEDNFRKSSSQELLSLYDFDSIMHYGAYAFSSNGKKTIVPISNPSATIGQRNSLSSKDITELNVLYDCQSTSTDFYSTWGNWQPCNSNCQKKRQRFCSHTNLANCPTVDQHGVESETAACTQAECNLKIDGHWGKWSSWSTCSKTCDQGQITRTRICDDPAPKNGGADCVGAATSSSPCKTKSCVLGPDDCEFESGYCAWTKESTADQLEWLLHSGSTPSTGTGPAGDHTGYGHGSYIYMEASSPALSGQTAVLTSKTITKLPGGVKCLTFWYHMYGSGMGKLAVVVKDSVTLAETTVVTLAGNIGDKWNKHEVDINVSNDFQIKLKAERGYSYESDIAVDDIFITDGSCHQANVPLGMEDKRIKYYQISSSSDWDFYSRPDYARLNHPGPTTWCANPYQHGTDQFIRVDFDKRQLIYGVAVQGEATYDNWVTSYKVKYTEDGYIWKMYKENGIDKVFTGPTSRNTPVKHNFASPIHAFGFMVNPQTFHGNEICMRIEIYGKEDPSQPSIPAECSTAVVPLGMASGEIPNSQITATSIWDIYHQAYNARLNSYSVWCAAQNHNAFQHVKVDLGKLMTVYAIATQGDPTWDNYVTSYEIAYSENGSLFYDVLTDTTSFTKRVFTGNTDRHGIVKHRFDPPLKARFIQIEPKSYIGYDVCLRAELYGCE